jgi:hypothetical protein
MRKPRAFLLMTSAIVLWAGNVLAEDGRPAFRLVWLDSPSAAGVVRTEAMSEAASLLGSAGVDVEWERTDGRQRPLHEGDVQVVVLPSAPASLAPDVMGWTHPHARGARTVWVFLSGVRATLGQHRDGRGSVRSVDARDLGRAVGRVIVHELVHVVFPDRAHSHSGLMAPRVGRRVLLQPGLRLDVHLHGRASAR